MSSPTSTMHPPLKRDLGEAIELIRNVPFFTELDRLNLEKIVRVGVRKKYKRGNFIFQEDDPGAALFVIISGSIKITRAGDDGREVILSILGEHDFFGEMSILDGLTRSASAVAITEVQLFTIHQRDFLALLAEVPSVALALLRELAIRLRKAGAQIKSLSLKDTSGRVANVLIQLADEIGTIRKGRVEIDELPLQQDLGNMAGTSRESVSRMIHSFMKQGYIELEGNKLIINDYEKFKGAFT